MRKLEDFEGCLEIDETNLDQELMRQPATMQEISLCYAEAVSIRDAGKQELERTYAEVSLQVREDFADSGRKVTEDLVLQTTLASDEYVAAQKDYLDAKLECDQWSGLKEAFIQRSFMLRDLVQLYIAGYFTDSAIKGGEAAAGDAKYEITKRKMAATRQTT